ncbi:MAG: hypothetical protein OXF41_02380 [bacterium]|nr:hypothetical protein [bacterium]
MSEGDERAFPAANVSPAVDWMGPRELENRITKLETTVNIMRWIVGALLAGVVSIAGWAVIGLCGGKCADHDRE